jgi:hypothetical protein
MSKCKQHGMDLLEYTHVTDNMQGNVFAGNPLFRSMLSTLVIEVFIDSTLFKNFTTATSEQNWHWTGGNAISNVAYSEEVELPDFTWRWFNTGDEIPKEFGAWMKGEPQQGFDKHYQTYLGCVAARPADWKLKTFNCRTRLPYICQAFWEP